MERRSMESMVHGKKVVKNTKKALKSFTYDIPVTSVFLDHFLKIS